MTLNNLDTVRFNGYNKTFIIEMPRRHLKKKRFYIILFQTLLLYFALLKIISLKILILLQTYLVDKSGHIEIFGT
jgi:uncharacterized membrane protein YqjE